jgi:hypothetical protein
MLKDAPLAIHRALYPGELILLVGGTGGPWTPANWAVRVQHLDRKGVSPAAKSGNVTLYAKRGQPIAITSTTPPILDDLGCLSAFTGVALGGELIGRLQALAASDAASDAGAAASCVQFEDLAMYADLIISLRVRHLGAPVAGATRAAVLTGLLKDLNRNAPRQLEWYADHGPTQPGETDEGYRAEFRAFRVLAFAYRATLEAQIKALG